MIRKMRLHQLKMQRFSQKSVRLLTSQEGTPVRTGVAATSVYGTTAMPTQAPAAARATPYGRTPRLMKKVTVST